MQDKGIYKALTHAHGAIACHSWFPFWLKVTHWISYTYLDSLSYSKFYKFPPSLSTLTHCRHFMRHGGKFALSVSAFPMPSTYPCALPKSSKTTELHMPWHSWSQEDSCPPVGRRLFLPLLWSGLSSCWPYTTSKDNLEPRVAFTT